MPAPDLSSLEKIQAELRRYEHPLLGFQAVEHPGGVQVIISLKVADILGPTPLSFHTVTSRTHAMGGAFRTCCSTTSTTT